MAVPASLLTRRNLLRGGLATSTLFVVAAGIRRATTSPFSDAALVGEPDATAGWVKSPANPVLGGALGTCFDVCLLRQTGLYQMWFSWRPRGSIALVESADGVHWDQPRIALAPAATGWEDTVEPAHRRAARGNLAPLVHGANGNAIVDWPRHQRQWSDLDT